MKTVQVNEVYQAGYSYQCPEPVGKHFDPEFRPDLTPQEMLQAGVFGGAYFTEVPRVSERVV